MWRGEVQAQEAEERLAAEAARDEVAELRQDAGAARAQAKRLKAELEGALTKRAEAQAQLTKLKHELATMKKRHVAQSDELEALRRVSRSWK